MIKMSVLLLAILAPLQLFIGDQHGLNTLKHQPIKIAAMEAHWESDKPVDFHIFAWPDEKAEKNDWALSIPNAGSLVLTHRLNGLIIGLKDVAPQNRPPVKTVFFAFRIMLAIGFFMIAAALIGAWLLWRGILFETRWYLRIVSHSWWTGFVAVVAGWTVTESGRQPWLVYGLLRTADAVSPVTMSSVAITLALFVVAYGVVFSAGIYYINRLIAAGPQRRKTKAEDEQLSANPLAGARDAGRQVLGGG
jgi:cytochrome bd ubiquinol oxidase subunit I